MDGRAVGAAVRKLAWPPLREIGFGPFTGRCAWRSTEFTVELIVFRSFSSYVAGGVGCTSYSFAVTSGVSYRALNPDVIKPKDYELTFRFELGKTLSQPWFTPGGTQPPTDRPDVWYVLEDGSNVDAAVEDAAQAIATQALPLLDRFSTPRGAFDALLTERSTNADFGVAGVSMPGQPDSPRWRDTCVAIGHLVTDDPRAAMRSARVLGG